MSVPVPGPAAGRRTGLLDLAERFHDQHEADRGLRLPQPAAGGARRAGAGGGPDTQARPPPGPPGPAPWTRPDGAPGRPTSATASWTRPCYDGEALAAGAVVPGPGPRPGAASPWWWSRPAGPPRWTATPPTSSPGTEHTVGRWLSDDQHRTLAAALDTVVPGDALTPGAGGAGGRGLRRRTARRVHLGPAPHLGRRSVLRPPRRRCRLRPVPGPGALGGAGLAHPDRQGGKRGLRPRGWPRLGDGFADLAHDDRVDRLAAATSEAFRDLLFEHACESLYGDPVYGGNRDGVGVAGDRLPGRLAARRLHRRRGDRAVSGTAP